MSPPDPSAPPDAQATPRFQRALDALAGLPVTCVCHCANLVMFDFGRDNKIVTRSGWEYFSDYALHVQCGWQLSRGDRVVAGAYDLLYDASGKLIPEGRTPSPGS